MAIYTRYIDGKFSETLDKIHDGILNSSMSASYEDGSDWGKDDVKCAVRVYERYSAFGGNRVSLNVTLVGTDGDLFLTGITSGGSQAVFFKINTVARTRFLTVLSACLNKARKQHEFCTKQHKSGIFCRKTLDKPNCMRYTISRIKGGEFCLAASAAFVLSLLKSLRGEELEPLLQRLY